MRFGWDEQQEMLRSTVQRFVGDRHDFETRRRRLAGGSPPETWGEMAELGLLAVPFAEEVGGIGGGPLELAIVFEEFGRGLVLEPYLSSIVLAGGIIRYLADDDQKSWLLGGLIAGERRLAFAYAEPNARYNLAAVQTRAMRSGAEFIMSGTKSVVFGAPHADSCFVVVRTGGDANERSGLSILLVPLDAPGLERRPYICVDGTPAAELVFNDVRVPEAALFGPLGEAFSTIERVVDEATVAVCAEAVGAMQALNEKCLEFAKTRHAFGQPIANFQAIQHRLVDMRLATEEAGAITLKAASELAADADGARRSVAACKTLVGEEAAFVGKNAVQLHGAIGMTDELDIGHYFRKLTAIQSIFGSADYQMRRYIEAKELHRGS